MEFADRLDRPGGRAREIEGAAGSKSGERPSNDVPLTWAARTKRCKPFKSRVDPVGTRSELSRAFGTRAGRVPGIVGQFDVLPEVNERLPYAKLWLKPAGSFPRSLPMTSRS